MGNCHFKTDFDAENITGKFHTKVLSKEYISHKIQDYTIITFI